MLFTRRIFSTISNQEVSFLRYRRLFVTLIPHPKNSGYLWQSTNTTMMYHLLSQQVTNHHHHYHHHLCKCYPAHHRHLYQICQRTVESKTTKRQTWKGIGSLHQKKKTFEKKQMLWQYYVLWNERNKMAKFVRNARSRSTLLQTQNVSRMTMRSTNSLAAMKWITNIGYTMCALALILARVTYKVQFFFVLHIYCKLFILMNIQL